MIVDVFMFDDEFDMLDCRLHELTGVVDQFVLIEADHTFTGIPKAYNFSGQAHRYAEWPISILRAHNGDVDDIADTIPGLQEGYITDATRDCWKRELIQRNAARKLLSSVPDDAIVLYGDVDEIPRREVVAAFDGGARALRQRLHIYSLRLIHPSPWHGTIIGRRGHLGTDMATVRLYRMGYDTIFNGGWHLTWFGTPEDRVRKLRHFSHQEFAHIGGQIGSAYPSMRQHVDGTVLAPWLGDAPRWVEEGLAPSNWTKLW